MGNTAKPYRWKFFRAGGVDQVVLSTGDDLTHLDELDPKLWVALSMPTKGVDVDSKTLELLDLDKDGHIRHPEIIAAVKWVREVYAEPGKLLEGGDEVSLRALETGPLLESAKEVLTKLGKVDAWALTLDDVLAREKLYADTWLDGDGVIPAEAGDGEAKRTLEDVLATHGPVPDRRGVPGVDEARVKAFFEDVRAQVAWYDAASKEAMPIGADTAAAFDAVDAVRAKVDDYFTRCRLAAFDPRAAALLMPSDAQLTALGAKALAPGDGDVASLPLALVEAQRPLPLDAGVNPAWADRIDALQAKAVAPLIGARVSLTEDEWHALCAKLAAHAAWRASKPAGKASSLGEARVRELAGGSSEKDIAAIIERDRALAPLVARLRELEQLCLYQRDLARVLRNYVNFSEFYGDRSAVFQAGTLFLDGRGCELCVEVADAARHGSMAPLAGAYLAYCDVVRVGADKAVHKKAIAAAFTNGDADNLLVGRNGVFFDRAGDDWEATITKVVDNPISIRQAFWAPYKKFARMIEEQVAKRASAADTAAHAKLADAAIATANADKMIAAPPADPAAAAAAAAAAAPPPPKKTIDLGTIAALGVAVGGIGAFIGALLTSIFGLGVWMPVGVIALTLMISGPSMLLAYLKLRTRNLGPLLDANGWAINGRARINVPFGTALTGVAALPPGAGRSLKDPYAEQGRPWKLYIALALIFGLAIGWYLGKLDKYLPTSAKSITVLGKNAPAWEEPKPVAAAPAATPTPK
ncbi:MAG TPA: hypothetical protein VL463_31075 [Kofleriaceae bacterium]|nr:hypothetical protein [Kofleriaceae bacterium]